MNEVVAPDHSKKAEVFLPPSLVVVGGGRVDRVPV
jgi:hypothetical protein